jgi:hypothetical protein
MKIEDFKKLIQKNRKISHKGEKGKETITYKNLIIDTQEKMDVLLEDITEQKGIEE